MSFGIYSYAKVKGNSGGLQKEHQRTPESDITRMSTGIDGTKTHTNEHYGVMNYDEEARRICSELNVKTRSNSILLLDHCVTFSPEAYPNLLYIMHSSNSRQDKLWRASETGSLICEIVEEDKAKGINIMEEASKEIKEVKEYFDKAIAWIGNNKGVVISYDIHWDESTPHVHVLTVPLIEREPGKFSLSAKELVGNRGTMRKTQKQFYEEVSKEFRFEPCRSTPSIEEVQKQMSNAEYWIDQYDKIAQDRQEEISFLNNDIEILQDKKEALQGDVDRIEDQKEIVGAELREMSMQHDRINAAIDNNKDILRRQKQQQAVMMTEMAEKIQDMKEDAIEEIRTAKNARDREVAQTRATRSLWDMDMGR